jgi:Uma2 family endonuclease
MAVARQYVEKDRYTEDDYFGFSETAFGRWEYVDGQMRMMAGGTDDHNTVCSNIVGTLRSVLMPRGCRVYGSDMKVHCDDGTNTFPDVSVVCGPRQYHRGRTDIYTNPLLIVEVLSPTTEGYDRSEKFDHYRTIPSLVDYLMVSPDEARVLLYTYNGDHWDFHEVTGLTREVSLTSVDVTLALSDVYALIELPTEPHRMRTE